MSRAEKASVFLPTLLAARERLDSFKPESYARTRNQLDGAVSQLSPYLTHGFLTLAEVFRSVNARHRLEPSDKFVFELGWRAYYRHVWYHVGNGIQNSIHPGPLPEHAYSQLMPRDVAEGRTGIQAIDRAVKHLYQNGYLHNHARMWLASYLVHLRKVHWHCGAQWMLGHLLDGDAASNHLSWQWVAGTNSVKPYLFNADNVARFAPADWHSFGTAIDVNYEQLNRIAYDAQHLPPESHRSEDGGMSEPELHTVPLDKAWHTPDGLAARGKDIWLMHPWSMGEVPAAVPAGALRIAVAIIECHAGSGWDRRRWEFVTQGMQAGADVLWRGNTDLIAKALEQCNSVQWQSDQHADRALDSIAAHLVAHGCPTKAYAKPDLFTLVESYCTSFSKWWRQTRLIY